MKLNKKTTLEYLNSEFNVPLIVPPYEVLPEEIYSLRSNSPEEDGEYTNAGKFDTKLAIKGKDLPLAISKLHTPFFIQEMLEPDYSFVFIKTKELSFIQVNNGLCNSITSGEATGFTYSSKDAYMSKFGSQDISQIIIDNEVKTIESKVQKWKDMFVLNLVLESNKVGCYLDLESFNIEGSVKDGKIYILQARKVFQGN